MRSSKAMTDTDEEIARLGRALAKAVSAEDFEEAARLQASIDRLAGVDPARRAGGLKRGSPGAMGLGTDQVTLRRRQGWRPPPRPNLMTSETKPARDRPKGR
jgi:hypothetical protein